MQYNTYVYIYIYTYIHAYIHIYIYIHAYTYIHIKGLSTDVRAGVTKASLSVPDLSKLGKRRYMYRT